MRLLEQLVNISLVFISKNLFFVHDCFFDSCQVRTGSNSQCPEIIQVDKEQDAVGVFGANSQGSCD